MGGVSEVSQTPWFAVILNWVFRQSGHYTDYTGERLPKGKPLKPEEHEMFKRAEYEFF